MLEPPSEPSGSLKDSKKASAPPYSNMMSYHSKSVTNFASERDTKNHSTISQDGASNTTSKVQ